MGDFKKWWDSAEWPGTVQGQLIPEHWRPCWNIQRMGAIFIDPGAIGCQRSPKMCTDNSERNEFYDRKDKLKDEIKCEKDQFSNVWIATIEIWERVIAGHKTIAITAKIKLKWPIITKKVGWVRTVISLAGAGKQKGEQRKPGFRY